MNKRYLEDKAGERFQSEPVRSQTAESFGHRVNSAEFFRKDLAELMQYIPLVFEFFNRSTSILIAAATIALESSKKIS